MSIFTKDCPQCATANPVGAVRCACGHCFDLDAVTDKKAVVEVAIHEERLYHDYLAARVIQAEAAYEVARADALADPGDTLKAAHALAAEQALNTVRAEWRQQAQKTVQLKKLTVRSASETRSVAPMAKPRITKRKHATTARTGKPHAQTKATAAKPMPAPASATPVAPIPAKQSAPAGKPAMPDAQPSRAFRARQAKHAEAIARKVTAAVETPVTGTTAAIPAPAVRVAPVPTPAATKDCPNCTAKVPTNTAQCRCGYGFNMASLEMASLPLDAAALAILRR